MAGVYRDRLCAAVAVEEARGRQRRLWQQAAAPTDIRCSRGLLDTAPPRRNRGLGAGGQALVQRVAVDGCAGGQRAARGARAVSGRLRECADADDLAQRLALRLRACCVVGGQGRDRGRGGVLCGGRAEGRGRVRDGAVGGAGEAAGGSAKGGGAGVRRALFRHGQRGQGPRGGSDGAAGQLVARHAGVLERWVRVRVRVRVRVVTVLPLLSLLGRLGPGRSCGLLFFVTQASRRRRTHDSRHGRRRQRNAGRLRGAAASAGTACCDCDCDCGCGCGSEQWLQARSGNVQRCKDAGVGRLGRSRAVCHRGALLLLLLRVVRPSVCAVRARGQSLRVAWFGVRPQGLSCRVWQVRGEKGARRQQVVAGPTTVQERARNVQDSYSVMHRPQCAREGFDGPR